MKNKIFSLLSLSILTILVLISFASALTISSSTTALSQENGSFTVTLTNTAGAGALTYAVKDSSNTVYTGFTFNQSAFTGNEALTVLYTVPADFVFDFEKTYTVTVTATETVVPTNTGLTTLTFEDKFYSGENNGVLDISDINLDVLTGFGDNDEYWYPLDKVEVEFTVENNGDWDVKNIEVQACLFDKEADECIMDEEDMDLNNDDFDLDSDDEQLIKLTFQVDVEKLTAGNNDYILYLKAVGEVDDSDSTYDGNETGISTSKSIKIITNDELVVLDNVKFVANSVSCGGTVQVTGTAWNVGEDDESDVYVKVYNSELGINQQVEIGDIDSFDNEDFSFTLKIPSTAKEGTTYELGFSVYDDSDDIFETDDEDQAKFFYDLTVTEGCSTVPTALVTASLQSEAKSGQELTVKATIVNTGSTSNTFNLALNGYNTWASLVSMDQNTLTLSAGEAKEVLIKLKVNEDISGDQTFNIGLTQGTKSLSQPVSVSIAKKQGISLPNFAGLLGGNSWIWIIGALNVLLILVIVIVAIKVSKKK